MGGQAGRRPTRLLALCARLVIATTPTLQPLIGYYMAAAGEFSVEDCRSGDLDGPAYIGLPHHHSQFRAQ
jgi:hypothetical protein